MPSVYYPGLERHAPGDLLELTGEEYHHLAHVAPRRLSQQLKLNSGEGMLAEAAVETLERNRAWLRLQTIERHPSPARPYAIAFALLKNRNDEWLVEKCTELGVSRLFPLLTERGLKTRAESVPTRFRKIALAAIKQCDNPWLPEVAEIRSLAAGLSAIRDSGYLPVLCSERRPDMWLSDLEPEGKPCFLIGPEGGWSDAEFALMEGLPEITLSRLITRAETAAVAVSAQWLAYANQPRTTGTR